MKGRRLERSSPYIAVAGSMNVDICAKSFSALKWGDSNPGRVSVSPGGVGRNIAQNLSLLGAEVRLFSALGDDGNAKYLERSCQGGGIQISRVKRIPGGRTPSYVFIAGPEGDMALAVCDAELAEEISPAYLAEQLAELNGAGAVVVEANLSPDALRFVAEHCEAPVFADPVSTAKCERLRPLLGRLHMLKPNRLEAEVLSGVKITGEASLRAAAKALLETGLKQVCISLGAEGVFYADQAQSFQTPCLRTALVNATGGGDAMMAALVLAHTAGMPPREMVRFSLAASAITVEAPETINPSLRFADVMKRAGLSRA